MTPADTAELRRLLAAATPGPWNNLSASTGAKWISSRRGVIADLHTGTQPPDQQVRDAVLIVAAVNALPGLLDAAESWKGVAKGANDCVAPLVAERDALKAEVERLRKTLPHCWVCEEYIDPDHERAGNYSDHRLMRHIGCEEN